MAMAMLHVEIISFWLHSLRTKNKNVQPWPCLGSWFLTVTRILSSCHVLMGQQHCCHSTLVAKKSATYVKLIQFNTHSTHPHPQLNLLTFLSCGFELFTVTQCLLPVLWAPGWQIKSGPAEAAEVQWPLSDELKASHMNHMKQTLNKYLRIHSFSSHKLVAMPWRALN